LLLVFDKCFGVQVRGTPWPFHTSVSHPTVMYCPFINHYMSETNKFAHEHAQTTTELVNEEKAVNKVEEKEKQVEPLPNFSNDKDVSIEANSFVIISLKTQHESLASRFQCLEEPSYVEIFKESCTQDHKSRNRVPKWILQSKQLGYIRWRNILPKGYQILKKK
jgi:hypothetical protein